MVVRYETLIPVFVSAVVGAKFSLTGSAAFAVSLNVTLPIFAALAFTVLDPASVPSVNVVDAVPPVPVTALNRDRLPPPVCTVKVTVTRRSTPPLGDLTLTTRALDRVVATTPVWL